MENKMKKLSRLGAVGALAILSACQPSNKNGNNVTKVAGSTTSNGQSYAQGSISGATVQAAIGTPTIQISTDGSGNNVFAVQAPLVVYFPNGQVPITMSANLTQAAIAAGGAIQNTPAGNGIQIVTQFNCSDATACTDLLISTLVIATGGTASATQFGFIFSTTGQNVQQANGGYSATASYMFPQVTNTTNEVAFADVEATLMSTVPGNWELI